MAEQAAALMKINFVLDVARKSTRFLNDLERDPFKTLMESGIDLSPGETQAIIDIVTGSSLSYYVPALKNTKSRWVGIVEEAAVDLERIRAKAKNEDEDSPK